MQRPPQDEYGEPSLSSALVSTPPRRCHGAGRNLLDWLARRHEEPFFFGTRSNMANPPINPYAPPKVADVAPAELVFGDLDVGRTVTEAWESCRRHFPLWLGVVLVAIVLMVGSALTV